MPGEQSRSQLTKRKEPPDENPLRPRRRRHRGRDHSRRCSRLFERFLCSVTDNTGNSLVYTFANSTGNADGSAGGTYVETGFVKNGQPVVSPVGRHRPIWSGRQ